MTTRKYYTLGYVLMAVGLLLALSFIPISYLGAFGLLPADPWAVVMIVNIPAGAVLGLIGAALAGEL